MSGASTKSSCGMKITSLLFGIINIMINLCICVVCINILMQNEGKGAKIMTLLFTTAIVGAAFYTIFLSLNQATRTYSEWAANRESFKKHYLRSFWLYLVLHILPFYLAGTCQGLACTGALVYFYLWPILWINFILQSGTILPILYLWTEDEKYN